MIKDCSVINDPKKTWKLINSLLGRNAKSNNVNELMIDVIAICFRYYIHCRRIK